MREIKFRAWSSEHNRYCDFITLDENGRWIGWIKSSGVYLTTADIILEQDTGLKDKNGKKICEGDILWWEHYYGMTGENIETTAKVYWEEKDASFVVGDWFEPLGHLVDEDEVEVIGNIHENPELVKEVKNERQYNFSE